MVAFRGLLVISFLFVFIEYVILMSTQSRDFDIYSSIENMKKQNKIIGMQKFEARFFHCKKNSSSSESCESSAKTPYFISFPNVTSIEKYISENNNPNRVELIYTFSPEEKKFLSRRDNITLAMPSFVARRINIQFGTQSFTVISPKNTATSTISLPLESKNLQENSPIIITADITKLPWFGSINLPAAFTLPEFTYEYLSLENRMNFAKEISSRLEIGFPLLLAAIALVLDHAISFGLLSLFSMALATRSFIAYDFAHGGTFTQLKQLIYIISNAGFAGFLTLFILSLWNMLPAKKIISYIIIFTYLIGVGAIAKFHQDGLLLLDLLTDLSASIINVIIVCIGFILFLQKNKTADSEEMLNAKPTTRLIQAILLLTGFTIHISVNLSEFLQTNELIAKNFLDWRHNVLPLALITAALFEIGTVTKRIKIVATQAKARAILEEEMKLGKAMQKRMLGARKMQQPNWWARAIYYPAIHLAGDWYEIKEIHFSDNKTIIAGVVVDVAGHGVASALITSVICSQWGLWLNSAKHRISPQNASEREKEITHLLQQWNEAVFALGKQDSATAAIVILDPITGEFSYCTAGHPSIMWQTSQNNQKSKLISLRSTGDLLGQHSINEQEPPIWLSKSNTLNSNDLLCIYSDGLSIQLPQNSLGFFKHLEKSLQNPNTTIIAPIYKQIRELKYFFKKNRDYEDDITVLFLGKNS